MKERANKFHFSFRSLLYVFLIMCENSVKIALSEGSLRINVEPFSLRNTKKNLTTIKKNLLRKFNRWIVIHFQESNFSAGKCEFQRIIDFITALVPMVRPKWEMRNITRFGRMWSEENESSYWLFVACFENLKSCILSYFGWITCII